MASSFNTLQTSVSAGNVVRGVGTHSGLQLAIVHARAAKIFPGDAAHSDAFVRLIVELHGLATLDEAREWIAASTGTLSERHGSMPLDTASFRVIAAGPLVKKDLDDEARAELERLVSDGTTTTYDELVALYKRNAERTGSKPHLYFLERERLVASNATPTFMLDAPLPPALAALPQFDCRTSDAARGLVLCADGMRLVVDAPGPAPPPSSEGASFLRSLAQKIVRRRATLVSGEPARDVLHSTLRALVACPGSYNPNVHKFVRGVTSAFKRLAVMIVEDSWLHDAARVCACLLATAYACACLPDYWPSAAALALLYDAAQRAHASPRAFSYVTVATPRAHADADWAVAHRLIRTLRAFEGDMRMFAQLEASDVATVAWDGPAGEMRLEAAADRHCLPGVPLVLAAFGYAPTEREAHERQWREESSYNPRRTAAPIVESPAELLAVQRDAVARLRGTLPAADADAAACEVRVPLRVPEPDDVRVAIGAPAVGAKHRVVHPLGGGGGGGPIFLRAARGTTVERAVQSVEQDDDTLARLRATAPVVSKACTSVPGLRARCTFRCANLPLDELIVDDEPLPTLVQAREAASVVVRMAADAEQRVRDTARALDDASRAIFCAMLRAATTGATLRIPTGSASDVCNTPAMYRVCDVIARRVPAALAFAPAMPCFRVLDADVLAFVVRWIEAAPRDWQPSSRTGDVLGPRTPDATLHATQRAAVREIVAQLRGGRHGGIVTLPTGGGKTLVSLEVARALGFERVIFTTLRSAVRAVADEMVKRGVPQSRVHVLQAAPIPRRGVVVVNVDALRDRALYDALATAARDSFVVLDEADCLYGETQRADNNMCLAEASRRFVAMTATPWRTNDDCGLARVLSAVLGRVIPPAAVLVGAASIVGDDAQRIELVERDVEVPLTDAGAAALRDDKWHDMFIGVTHAADPELARVAREAAAEHGGALLVAHSEAHAQRLVQLSGGRTVTADGGDPGGAVVVVPMSYARGYNWATRLGALVMGVYPCSVATLTQLVGRIRRQGQRRDTVVAITVVMAGTPLARLQAEHREAQKKNAIVMSMARRFMKRADESAAAASSSAAVRRKVA